MIKLILFDLWQTLAYHGTKHGGIKKMMKVSGTKISQRKFTKIFEKSLQTKKWDSKKKAYLNLCKNIGIKTTDSNATELMRIRDKEEKKANLYVETIPLLKALKKNGYKTGLVSNSSVFAIKQVKKNTKILNHIDFAVFSYDVGAIKPSKKVFTKALQLAKCKPSETVMIGDKFGDDVKTPKMLGMHAIHFKDFGQLKKALKKLNIKTN
jgi:HAD superfamily hydrolase (TIGR01662 family)